MNRKWWYVVLTLTIAIFVVIVYDCAHISTSHKVLVIHSYESNYPLYPQFNQKIIEAFARRHINADMKVIYVNCECYAEKEELKHLHNCIDSVMRGGWKPEVICVNDDQATYSLLKCGHPIVRKAPIVFSGVNYPNYSLIHQFKNVTGFEDKMDIMKNIYFIKDVLHMPSVWICTALDSTFIDRKVRNDIKALRQKRVLGNISTPDIPIDRQWLIYRGADYAVLNSFPVRTFSIYFNENYNWPKVPMYCYPHKMILWPLGKYIRGLCYLELKRDCSMFNLPNVCANPYFSAINEQYGVDGRVLGGYMTTIDIQVDEQVEYASKILKGMPVASLPMTESKKIYTVDYNALQRFHLQLSDIPSYCEVIHQPLRSKYPLFWTGIVMVVVLLAIVLFILFLNERKKKNSFYKRLLKERNILTLSMQAGRSFSWTKENGVYRFDENFWNYINLKPHDITTEQMISYIHPDFRQLYRSISSGVHKETHGKAQMLYAVDSGGYRWWEARYIVTKEKNGHEIVYGLSIDIDDLKQREQQLDNLRKIADKMELKQSFIENMTHEIRTPLNAIIGFSDLLASESDLPEEVKNDYSNIIKQNNKALLEMIDGILLLSQLDSDQLSFSVNPLSVRDVVKEVYDAYATRIPFGIDLLYEEDDTASMDVKVDKKYLIHVLNLLMDNSLKFTKEGHIKIGYRLFPDDMMVNIFVEDTGIGIAKEQIASIFDRFYKNDYLSSGTGLGLSVSKQIINKFGGNIEVYSELGKGSCFCVFLPCIINK